MEDEGGEGEECLGERRGEDLWVRKGGRGGGGRIRALFDSFVGLLPVMKTFFPVKSPFVGSYFELIELHDSIFVGS